MRRKIIKQGENTLTITLPAKWARKAGIKAGHEVELTEKGNDLVVGSVGNGDFLSKEFTVKDSDKYLAAYPNNVFLRFIDTSYRAGYDELRINFDDARILELVQQETEFLLGFEVVEQGENYCVVRNIASAVETELDPILRRIFLMINGMFKDSYDAARAGKFSRMNNIATIEKTSNRLTNFCERLLNKNGYKDFRKTAVIYAMITLLEQIADDCRGLCIYLGQFRDNEVKLSRETISFFKQTVKLLENFYQLFYKQDRVKLYELLRNRHHILNNKAIGLMQTQPKKEMVVLCHLASTMGKIYHLAEAYD